MQNIEFWIVNWWIVHQHAMCPCKDQSLFALGQAAQMVKWTCYFVSQCIYVQYCFKYIVICNIVNVLQICRIACSNKQFATRLIEYLFAFHLKYLKQHTNLNIIIFIYSTDYGWSPTSQYPINFSSVYTLSTPS